MKVEAEVSLYPLAQRDLEPPVHAFLEALRRHKCDVTVGDMSSLVKGETQDVFDALRLGYERAAEHGGCVLVIKACNACAL